MGRPMTDPELYEADFYAWTKVQADRLRRLEAQRANSDLDLPRLAEVVEALGTYHRNALRRQLRRIIEHCLQLEWSKATDPRHSWPARPNETRSGCADLLSRTLQRDIP